MFGLLRSLWSAGQPQIAARVWLSTTSVLGCCCREQMACVGSCSLGAQGLRRSSRGLCIGASATLGGAAIGLPDSRSQCRRLSGDVAYATFCAHLFLAPSTFWCQILHGNDSYRQFTVPKPTIPRFVATQYAPGVVCNIRICCYCKLRIGGFVVLEYMPVSHAEGVGVSEASAVPLPTRVSIVSNPLLPNSCWYIPAICGGVHEYAQCVVVSSMLRILCKKPAFHSVLFGKRFLCPVHIFPRLAHPLVSVWCVCRVPLCQSIVPPDSFAWPNHFATPSVPLVTGFPRSSCPQSIL